MRALLLAVLGGAACEAAPPDEVPFLETRYVRYMTDQPFTPCGGLARVTDRQIEYIFDLLSEPYPASAFINYQWVEDQSTLTCSENAAGCAQATAGGAAIASIYLADPHELAHAVHLLTIGTSHRVLTEGFATYASSHARVAGPQDPDEFRQAIEGFVESGTLSAEQYPLAARFVGMTIERHGIAAFKAFWQEVARDAKLAELSTAYEQHFDESWSDAIAVIATRTQTVYEDPACEGEVQTVGDPLRATITRSCEDEGVTGPLRNSGTVAGELPVPIEIATEGIYRFRFDSAPDPMKPAATLRGCSDGRPAPVPAISLFPSDEDVTQYLDQGRYLLNIRVPLEAEASAAVDVSIEKI